MTVNRLDALRRGGGAPPSDGARGGSAGAGSAPTPEDELDPTHGLEFEPETGELVEKPPPGRRR